MLNSPPETRPEGCRTRFDPPTPRPDNRPRLLGTLSALTVISVSTFVGGWAGALAGLWVGRVLRLVRLGFSTGLTAGIITGLILGVLIVLATRPARR
jgi:hypothetical protein